MYKWFFLGSGSHYLFLYYPLVTLTLTMNNFHVHVPKISYDPLPVSSVPCPTGSK